MSPENPQNPPQTPRVISAEELEEFNQLTEADLLPMEEETPIEIPEMLETETNLSPEKIAELNTFLEGTFKDWGVDSQRMQKFRPSAEMKKPSSIDWKTLKADTKPDQDFGEYILNPECDNANYETAKEVIVPPEMVIGNTLAEVGENLAQTIANLEAETGKKYAIPDLRYYEWLYKNPTKTPTDLQDTSVWLNFFGSALRNSDGSWYVPCAVWLGSSWYRSAYRLDYSWDSVTGSFSSRFDSFFPERSEGCPLSLILSFVLTLHLESLNIVLGIPSGTTAEALIKIL